MKLNLHLFLLAMVLGPIAAFTQPSKALPEGTFGVDYNVTDGRGQKQGAWVRVYEDGSIYYKGQFKDNVPQGEFWFWYETGEAMSKVVHLDGTKHMDVINYHRNGYPMSSGHYRETLVDGKQERVRDGEWKFYTEEGILKTLEYYTMGHKEGLSTSYFETGKKLLEVTYANDQKNGSWKEYFEDGRVKGEGSYKDGQYDGEFILYQSGGRKLVQGTYLNGLKDGIWIQFNTDGSIQITTKFENGRERSTRRENGEFTDYYDSGIPKATYTYANGKKDGPFTEWYDMGEWIQEPMDEPMPGGGIQFKERLAGTQVECEGDYLDGKLEGEITWYDQNGRIVKIDQYVAGELETTEER